MRFFGFFIIRWARLQEIHARNRQLEAKLDAAADKIDALNIELLEILSEQKTAPSPADSGAQN